MAIEFDLNNPVNNDQTAGLQTDVETAPKSTDTDIENTVAAGLPLAFFNRLYDVPIDGGLGLDPTFPDLVGAACQVNSVTVTSDGELTGLRFTGAVNDNGTPGDPSDDFAEDLAVFDGGNFDAGGETGLTTVDGEEIHLFKDAELGDTMVLGIDENGETVFAVYMEATFNLDGSQATVDFYLVTFEAIDHGDDTNPDDEVNLGDFLTISAEENIVFDFDGTPSGKNLFTMIKADGVAVVVTNIDEQVVLNTSKGGGPTTLGLFNQMIDPGEEMVFTFVTNPVDNFTVPNLDQNEADLEGSIQFNGYETITGGTVFIAQVQGGSPASLTLKARLEDEFTTGGNGFIDDYGDDPFANITRVIVEDAAGNVLVDTNISNSGGGVTVNLNPGANGSWAFISGIKQGYDIIYEAEPHQRLSVLGEAGKFDIGGIGIDKAGAEFAAVGQNVVIDDDGPTAALATTAAEVTLDETDNDGVDDFEVGPPLADVTTPISTLFDDTSEFGTDEEKDDDDDGTVDDDATTYSLVLNAADGVNSGLVDTATGNPIQLFQVDEFTIEGRVDTDGNGTPDTVAFSIHVLNDDATEGDAVRVIQSRAVVHDDPDDPDESDNPETIDPDLVLLRVTVIDDDGDEDSDDAELGSRINFEDDGPSITVAANATDVTHDETPGVDTGLGDDDVAGDTLPAPMLDAFNAVSDTGNDADVDDADNDAASTNNAIGYARSGGPLVTITSQAFGSDGEADADEIAYALKLGPANTDGMVESGVQTTEGDDVFLFLENGVIVGRVDTDGDGTALATDPAAFAISIDSATGEVFTAQWLSLTQNTASNDDEVIALNDQAVEVEATITDGDGDTDTDSDSVGDQIKFGDDGPTVTVAGNATDVTHDETPGVDTDPGDDDVAGNTLPAPMLDAFNAVSDTGNDADVDDADNDAASTNNAIGYARSGTPLVDVNSLFGADGEADADEIAYALKLGPANTDGMVESGVQTTEGDDVFLFLENGVIVGRVDTDGDGTALATDPAAFAISIDSATGEVFTAQWLSLTQNTASNDDEVIALADQAVEVEVTITDGDGDTDTDSDSVGDQIKFGDDGPTAAITDTEEVVIHDETAGVQDGSEPEDDNLPDPHDDHDQPLEGADADPNNQDNLPLFFAALGIAIGWAKSAAAVVTTEGTDFGADGEDSAVWSLAVGDDAFGNPGNADSDFDTLDGWNILLNVETVGTEEVVVGRVDDDNDGVVDGTDDVAIAIYIDQLGFLSTAQYVPIAHEPDTGPDQQAIMNDDALLAVLTVTDGDGDFDTVTEAIGDKVIIEDDAPITAGLDAVPLEEDDLDQPPTLSDGNDEDGSGDNDSGTVDITAGVIQTGVDDPVTFTLSGVDPNNVLPQLFSKGEALTYVTTLADNKIEAFADLGGAGERLVFTFVLSDDGLGNFEGTLTLNDQLDHVPFGDDDDGQQLLTDPNDPINTAVDEIDFTALVEGTDADGDPVETPDVKFVVSDDVPLIAQELDGTADPIEGGTVDFEDGDSITRSLKGSIGTDENGADNLSGDGATKTYTFASFTESFLIDRDGDGLYDAGQDNLIRGFLSADGTTVEYFEDLDGNLGTLDLGDPFYEITLDQTANSGAGSYTFTVLQDPPPAFLEFNFEDLPSGSNLFGMIASDKSDLSGPALLMFGRDVVLQDDGTYDPTSSDRIKTSQGGGPVTIGVNEQMFDPGEGAYFVYVTDPTASFVAGVEDGLDPNEADDADNVEFDGTVEVSGASVEVVQRQGNKLIEMKITAFDVTPPAAPMDDQDSRDFVLDPESFDEGVDIISVRVFDELGNKIEDTDDPGNFDDADVVVTFNAIDGSVNVAGIDAGYTIEFETDGLHDMALIEGVVGKFDVGGFNLSEAQPTPDQLYEFEVAITDFDGDSATSNQFDITVDGTGPFDSGEYDDGTLVV